jgi:arylsulfatase A-like enzyme
MPHITRRDFLKLASITPMAVLARPLAGVSRAVPNLGLRNIIVLIFDAWSADHMSMYGYPRPTMPNLEKFAERALVFHRHYSAGTFTVPGTASLLTGLYPWSHRALSLGGEIEGRSVEHQIFNLLSATHHTLGYTQNQYADVLLSQVERDLDRHPSISSFSVLRNLFYSAPLFQNDKRLVFEAFDNDIFQKGKDADSALFAGPLRRLLEWRTTRALNAEYRMSYPRGLPAATDLFRLEDAVDGAIEILGSLQTPSLAYLHFWPPHGYYRPKGKYNHAFMDGWQPPQKPTHPLMPEPPGSDAENDQQRLYDQYLASWDAELARLLDYLKTSGLLDTSYVIITSDHGELFERGAIGHYCPLIYDPLVHVPLIVCRPGQTERLDVQAATSNVDLLPTIAALTGLAAPGWAEGRALPLLGGMPDEERSIYSMDAKTNSAFAAFSKVTLSLTKGDYRLTYYQYPEIRYEQFELYNLRDDPDEMRDLYTKDNPLAVPLKDELLQKLADANRHFPA